ncbi:MAG: DMT family transporter [bacterium]|nr:DMT family transporter [bacterium]
MPTEHRRGILWALAAAIGIAGFVIPWKVASTYGESAINTLLLLAIAAIFNSLLTGYRQRSIPRFGPVDLGIATALAAFTLFGNLASASAIQLLSPALLTVMQRSEVIIVALLAWPIIGERIDARFWIGAAVAGCGLFLLQDAVSASEPRAVGIVWAAVSAFCFASMAVITRLFIRRIDLVAVNALRLWIAVALWFVFNGFPPEILDISAAQAGYVGLAAFFGPFMGRLCMMNSARYIEARITTLATLAAPPLTLVLGAVLLSDQPSAREIQGGVVMLIGIAIPVLGWAKRRPTSAGPSSSS